MGDKMRIPKNWFGTCQCKMSQILKNLKILKN